MWLRSLKARFKRSQRQVEDLSKQTEEGIEQHLIARFYRLNKVRRFVIGWVCLMLVLIIGVLIQTDVLSGYFQRLEPVPGGIYNEGVVGTFSTANPLYATSDIDTTVSDLVFAGLFKYNNQNQLVGDLASGYKVNSEGNIYTVQLKPHLTWQDGKPLTAQDVVFTYHLIQDPDAQSPLFNDWQDVNVSASGPLTVVFKLPDPLASFPTNLTNGIVPQHLLQNIPPTELRSANFNTIDPVGSGPFSWDSISVSGNSPTNAEEQIALLPFSNYQGGKPKLREFIVHAYAASGQLVDAFKAGQLTGAEGLDEVPPLVAKRKSTVVHNLILTAGVYSFFKTSSGILSDQTVRSALVQAVNTSEIIKNLGYPTYAVNEPLLQNQLGYNPAYKQPGYNLEAARNLLTQDGWVEANNGYRTKNGQPLSFEMTVADTPEYRQVATELKYYWTQVGARVNLNIQDSNDFSNSLQQHDYDSILYGISIGTDPDTFVYWDSSQADVRSSSRLNLSEYDNPIADEYLEGGRTTLNPAVRVAKYQLFLQQWQQNLPALGLYQPRLLYLTNGPVFGLDNHFVNTNSDRFDNVQNWEINEAQVTR